MRSETYERATAATCLVMKHSVCSLACGARARGTMDDGGDGIDGPGKRAPSVERDAPPREPFLEPNRSLRGAKGPNLSSAFPQPFLTGPLMIIRCEERSSFPPRRQHIIFPPELADGKVAFPP